MSSIITAPTAECYEDGYDRLRNCAEILASDPGVENAESRFRNAEALVSGLSRT